MFKHFPLFRMYLVRRWALNGIEMSKSGKKWNREWNFWMHFDSYALKGIQKFHSRFHLFPDFDISMPSNAHLHTVITWLRVIMNKKYEIQCTVRRCTTKRGRTKSVPIHRFPKRGDAGQQCIETCANSYLSRLEYFQVVEKKLLFVIDISINNISIRREKVLFF